MRNLRAMPKNSRMAAALGAVLVLAATWPALAAEPRHLNPAVAAQLEAAVTDGGSLQLVNGHVDVSTARLKVCQGANACADVTLSDPEHTCPGAKAGAWCVQFAGTLPPFAPSLQAQLAAMAPESVWQTTAAKKPMTVAQAPGVQRPAWTWPLALAWLLVPLALGMAIGRLARKRRKARVWALLVATGIVAGLGLALAFAPVIGLWDFLLGAGLLMTAAARFAEPAPPSPARRRVAIAFVLLLVTLEIVMRVRSSAPSKPIPPPATALLPADLEHAVGLALDPTAVCAELFESPTATEDAPRGKRIVLVLGDEAAAGQALAPPQRAHMQLDLGADVTAINRTVADTSLDAQYLLAAREIPRLRPQLVVLFPNDVNDLAEIGRIYGCCGRVPLLDVAADTTPTVLCTDAAEPYIPGEFAAYVMLSPWPWPMRVIAAESRALTGVFSWLDASRLRVFGLQPLDAQARRVRYIQLLQHMKTLTDAQHARLVVVGLPLRGREGQPRDENSPLALAQAAGLDVLDASQRFADALRAGEPLYLSGDPSDPQLGGVGHHLLATWLSPQLRDRLTMR